MKFINQRQETDVINKRENYINNPGDFYYEMIWDKFEGEKYPVYGRSLKAAKRLWLYILLLIIIDLVSIAIILGLWLF